MPSRISLRWLGSALMDRLRTSVAACRIAASAWMVYPAQRDWSVHQARANACAFQMRAHVLRALRYSVNALGLAWERPHTRQLSSDAGSVPSVWQDVWQAA